MGQLFDRFKNYVKSEVNYKDYEIPNKDEELFKIIEELNQAKTASENKTHTERERTAKNHSNQKMDLTKACEILEIPIDADLETIQNSYRRLVKEYHPDRVNNMGKEIRLLAERKTIEINQAYEYIKTIKNI